jgi:hypothetical protein
VVKLRINPILTPKANTGHRLDIVGVRGCGVKTKAQTSVMLGILGPAVAGWAVPCNACLTARTNLQITSHLH